MSKARTLKTSAAQTLTENPALNKQSTERPAAVAPAPPDPQFRSLEALKKRELVETVVKRSGVKKRDAKLVVEALLAELGETLRAGRELSLPPLGRVKINRQKILDDGRVIILKLRQKDVLHAGAPSEPAAE